jgi:hypothetical protein
MSFTYAAGTPNRITQTGTDTDLSGLSGVTGVTHRADTYKNEYVIASDVELRIEGTLTIDSETEQLTCKRTTVSGDIALVVASGGVLNVGFEDMRNSYTRNSVGVAIFFDRYNASNGFLSNINYSGLSVLSGGTLNWYGGEIVSYGVVNFAGNVNIYSQNCILRRPEDISNAPQIRNNGSNTDIQGITTINFMFTSVVEPVALNNYNPIHSNSVIDMSSLSTSNFFHTFYGLIAGQGNTKEFGGKNTTWARFINVSNGSDMLLKSQSTTNPADQDWLAEIRQEVTVTVRDISGNLLEGVKGYLIDTDNGNRAAVNAVGTSEDYTADKVYTDTSGADGLIEFKGDTGSILLAVIYHPNEDGDDIYTVYDYRSLSNSDVDDFVLYTYKYGYAISPIPLELKGENGTTVRWTQLPNLLITEATKATVDAYTSLDNAIELYDRSASYLEDNYLGEADLTFTREGVNLSAGSHDIVIDATAVSVYDHILTTVTLKSSAYTGGFTTSGSISTLNGATISNLALGGGATWNATQATWTGSATSADTIDVANAGTYDATGFTFDASTTLNNSSGGVVNITLAVGQQQPTVTGGTVNFLVPQLTGTITGLVAGSRIQVYNVTTATEIANEIEATTEWSFNYDEGSEFTTGDTVRVRATYVNGTTAKNEFQTTTVATAQGWAVLADQPDSSVYNTLAIDGSTITDFTADYIDDEVDVIVSGQFFASEWFAWWKYNLYLEQGIRHFFGGVTAIDVGNFKINNTVVDIKFDNNGSAEAFQNDNRRIYRDDGTRPVKSPTTSGFGVDLEWREPVLLAESGVSGLTPSESAKLLSLDTSNLDTAVSTRATQASVDTIDANVDAILVDTNELQTNQGDWATATGFAVAGDEMNLVNNAITSNKIATNALNNSAFTTGYYNSINSEVDTALNDYDAPTKAELDALEANILASIPADVLTTELETGFTVERTLRAMASVLAGKALNGPASTTFRNISDTDAMLTTAADENGNRTTVNISA